MAPRTRVRGAVRGSIERMAPFRRTAFRRPYASGSEKRLLCTRGKGAHTGVCRSLVCKSRCIGFLWLSLALNVVIPCLSLNDVIQTAMAVSAHRLHMWAYHATWALLGALFHKAQHRCGHAQSVVRKRCNGGDTIKSEHVKKKHEISHRNLGIAFSRMIKGIAMLLCRELGWLILCPANGRPLPNKR
jgi:hypothetical protein